MSEYLKYVAKMAFSPIYGKKKDKNANSHDEEKVYELERGISISHRTCQSVVKAVFGKEVDIASLKSLLTERTTAYRQLDYLKDQYDILLAKNRRQDAEIEELETHLKQRDSRIKGLLSNIKAINDNSVARIVRNDIDDSFTLFIKDEKYPGGIICKKVKIVY